MAHIPRVVAIVGLMALIVLNGFSQAAVRPTFEVASIKASDPKGSSAPLAITPRRLVATGLTLDVLIQWAYEVTEFQVVGGPDWLKVTQYEVRAQTEANATERQMKLMLQKLLTERCRLEVHRETKEFSGYALTLAKDGPKLQAVDEGTATGTIQIRTGGLMSGRGASIGSLARALSTLVGKPVMDRTSLGGKYDFKLEYDPTTVISREATLGNPPASTSLEVRASIFTALREQLGLRLDSHKGPVETLVIDHLERPSAN